MFVSFQDAANLCVQSFRSLTRDTSIRTQCLASAEALAMALVEARMMVLAEAKAMRPLVVATMVLASTAASKGMNDASHIIIAANLHIAT